MGNFSGRFLRVVDEVCATHFEYPKEAYCFVYEALGFAVHALDLDPDQHLSGEELIRVGVVPLAFKRWDFMAMKVLEYWNIFCSEDIGKIVQHLVTASVFNKSSTDCLEDFSAVDLKTTLEALVASNC